jgi:hypothetical protein
MVLIAMTADAAKPRHAADEPKAAMLESQKELPFQMFDRPAREDSEPPSRSASARLKLRFPLLFLRPPALPAFFVAACTDDDATSPGAVSAEGR